MVQGRRRFGVLLGVVLLVLLVVAASAQAATFWNISSTYTDDPVTLDWNVDGADHYGCQITNEGLGHPEQLCTSPQTFDVAGTIVYDVRAYDSANVQIATHTYTWTIDRTPPGPVDISGPDGIVDQDSVSLSWLQEDGASYVCTFDRTNVTDGQPCTSPQTTNLSGVHTFRVWGTDSLGNSDSTPGAFSFNNMNQPVTITWSPDGPDRPADGALSNVFPDFTWTVGGAEPNQTCQLDLDAAAPCTGEFGGGGQGPHTLTLTAYDAIGANQTAMGKHRASASRSWTTDTIAPATTLGPSPDEVAYGNSVTFTFHADPDGNGPIAFECSLYKPGDPGGPNLPWRACSGAGSDTTGPLTPAGSYTFYVRATDHAGNVEQNVVYRSFYVPPPLGGYGQAPVTPPSSGPTAPPVFPSNPSSPPFVASLCVVPKLKGATLTKAKKALTQSGCGVGKVKRKRHKGKIGRILSQGLRPGMKVQRGFKVPLTVSRR